MAEQSKEEHLAFIHDPDRWMAWPVLPLRNDKTGRWNKEGLGILLDVGGLLKADIRPVVYLINIFDRNEMRRVPNVPKKEYVSWDELWDAGWRVD